MKQKTKKRIQGSISVLLIIILLPTMVLSGLIVDTSRINMARAMVSSAGDLAINSALADYDTILKDVYGLFAMSQAKTSEDLTTEIKEYFENTLVSYGVTTEAEAGDYVSALMGDFNELLSSTSSMEVSNFLKMEVGEDFNVNKEVKSGLDNPEIMRRQIVDYMKYRAPANFGLSFLDSVKAFTTVKEQSEVVQAQVVAQESLQPVTKGCRTVIDGIRAFDTLVTAINSGDQAVKGVANYADPATVAISQYHDQIDKYKDIWGEKYQNINELNLIFLLKSPETTDKYLSSMSYGANDLFITSEEVCAENSGISLEVNVADNYEEAAQQVADQKAILSSEPYTDICNQYALTILKEIHMDYEKTTFTNREEAITAFIAFESFLLDNTSGTTVTYSEVAETLEQIYTLEVYHNNQMSLLNEEINVKKDERDAKKEEVDEKADEVSEAQTALEKGENAKETAEEALDALNDAQEETEEALAILNDANSALEACTESESSSEYKDLKKAAEEAQDAYDDAVDAEEDAQADYEEAVEAVPTEAELAQMRSNLQAKENEYNTLYGEYIALKQKVEEMESTKNLAESQYKLYIADYKSFTNAYQHDMELYEDYKAVAKQLITADAKAIQEQFTKIAGNVQSLMDALNQIGVDLGILRGFIEKYNGNVTAWGQSNQDYEDANSKDAFSKQNAADIAATKNQYDLLSLDTLSDYVKKIEEEYRTFYEYVSDPERYKYGTARIDTIGNDEGAVSAISDETKNALPEIVTKEDANNQFGSLFQDEDAPSIEIDKLTFVKDGVLPIQFLKYLNENFPEEAQNLTVKAETNPDGTPNTTDPKQQYDNMKAKMSSDTEGKEKIEGVDGDSYGYTFQEDDKVLDKSELPSNGKTGKTPSTESMTITESEETGVLASKSLDDQNKNLGSALGGVGAVLETGLENIYLMNYIFENFSYNTLIQDMVVKGEKLTTYPQVMDLSTNANLEKYLGKAKTLSNYNITGANNYLYGAEIEYILFGNEEPSKNITYTKGSIYAVRFAFNTIFAFTDSEIRNTTMAAGLAVQAATMGFVPYQVVQIVLQLALAAAESAVDLDMMSKGLKVVVVKTRDTWSLSVSGAMGMLTDSAAALTTEVIQNGITNAIEKVNEGINTVMEATAEELQGAVSNLTDTVTNAAKSKGQEIVDGVYTELQSKIDDLLNRLQFVNFSSLADDGSTVVMSQDEVNAQVNAMFEELKSNVNDIVGLYSGNPIADTLLPVLMDGIIGTDGVITRINNKILIVVNNAYAEAPTNPDVGTKICESMLQIKYDIINLLQNEIDELARPIENAVNNSISNVKDQLESYATEYVNKKGEQLEETLVKEVKDKVTQSLNDFSNTYLKEAEMKDVDLGTGGTGESKTTGSKVASMIKFGYKDYLMLLMFITVCANDDAILSRTGDIIQLNFQNATGEPDQEEQIVFLHQKGNDFKLSEAKTYVSVGGSVKLNMLFLDMDYFNRLLTDDSTDISEQMESASTVKYKGIAGY